MNTLTIRLTEENDDDGTAWTVEVHRDGGEVLPLIGLVERPDGSYQVFNWRSGDDEETHGETGDELIAVPFDAEG